MGWGWGAAELERKVPGRKREHPVRRRSVEKKVFKLQPTPDHSALRTATSQEASISPSAGHSPVLPAPGGRFRTEPGIGKKQHSILFLQIRQRVLWLRTVNILVITSVSPAAGKSSGQRQMHSRVLSYPDLENVTSEQKRPLESSTDLSHLFSHYSG